MSQDLYPYRASDELSAALREHHAVFKVFVAKVVAFDAAHPGHELLWKHRAMEPTDDTIACGFRDGSDEVPDGLSRAKTRPDLRPKRTKAGQWWQGVLDRMNHERPLVGRVFRQFDVPCSVSGGMTDTMAMRIAGVQWGDAGEDGVLVYASGPLSRSAPFGDTVPLSAHLTEVRLSEFYAIRERLEAEKAAAS